MEPGSRSSRQTLTIDDGSSKKKKKGCHVSYPTALCLVLLFVGAIAAGCFIVWYMLCPSVMTMQQRQDACEEMMEEMGRASVCGPEDKPKDMKEEKKTEDKEEKPTTGFRLNKTIIPIHYDLELWPRIYEGDDFGFDGNVTAWITCREDTNVIVLHVDMVTVHKDTILLRDARGYVMAINYTEQDVPRHFYKIYPNQRLMKNQNYSLLMRFNGTTIHNDLHGFYRGSYMENGTKHWLVSTHFETTSTRRCFPCFDENFFKATFKVTLVRRNDFISLSNMAIQRTMSKGGQWKADIFQKTLRMSPHRLAFSINQFVYVESFTRRGIQMRIYTQPNRIQYAEYINRISAKILEAYEEWTGIPYHLPKLDRLVVPSFPGGSMSNWGLIILSELSLLYNPRYSDIDHKRHVAYSNSHDIAQMAGFLCCFVKVETSEDHFDKTAEKSGLEYKV